MKLDGYWKLRIDIGNANEQQMLKLFGADGLDVDLYASVWYIHEDGKRHARHTHGLIHDCPRSDEWMRQRIKKWQTDNGIVHNASYAISNTYARGIKMTEEHLQRYVTYMAKGKYEVAYHSGHGFTTLTDNAIDSWVNYNAPTPITDQRHGNHRVTTHDLVNHAYGLYMDGISNAEDAHAAATSFDKQRLTECVITTLKHYKKGRNVNLVASVIQSLLADLSPTHYRALLNKRIGW